MKRYNRRQFFHHLAAGTSVSLAWPHLLPAAEDKAKGPARSIVVLWLDGGASHIDLWSVGRHVGHQNQGPFQPIKTTAKSIEISEAMPQVAKQFKHLSVIRTLNSMEGDAARATIRMLTGFPPSTLGVKIPHIGAVVGRHLAQAYTPVPFVSVGGVAARIGAGFLGPTYAPLTIHNPGMVPENVRPPQMGDAKQTGTRVKLRSDLLTLAENNFRVERAPHLVKENDRRAFRDPSQEHAEVVERALALSDRLRTELFEFNEDDERLLPAYGNTGFGRGCLLARKLVEAGVSAVQVDLGGWNMHGNIADGIRGLGTGVLDPAMATLVRDLAERDLLQHTLVVCLSQYGRMPRINQAGGRSAWSNGWDIVLGGAGIRPGVEYGRMAVGGMEIEKDPVSVYELFATLYAALNIDLEARLNGWHGQFWKDKNKPIKELLAAK